MALVMNALDLWLGHRVREVLGVGLRIAGCRVGLFWGDDHRRGCHRVVGRRNSEPLPPAARGGAARA